MAYRLNKSILESSNSPDGGLLLFALPPKGAHALISVAELLTYDATWIDDDGKRSPLTDAQHAIIDETITGLMEWEEVNLIVAEMARSTAELAGIRSELAGIKAGIEAANSAPAKELIEDELQDLVTELTGIAVLLGV